MELTPFDNLRETFLEVADEVKSDLITPETKAVLIVGSLANSVVGKESDIDFCVIKDGGFEHKPGPHFSQKGIMIAVDDVGIDYVYTDDIVHNYLLANKILNSIILFDRDGDFKDFVEGKKESYYSDIEVRDRVNHHWNLGEKILTDKRLESISSNAQNFLSFFRGFCPAVIYFGRKSPTTRRMYCRFIDSIESDSKSVNSMDSYLGLVGSFSELEVMISAIDELSKLSTNAFKIVDENVYYKNENYLNQDSVNLFIAVARELWNDFEMSNASFFCLRAYAAIILELIYTNNYQSHEHFRSSIEIVVRIFDYNSREDISFLDEVSKLKRK